MSLSVRKYIAVRQFGLEPDESNPCQDWESEVSALKDSVWGSVTAGCGFFLSSEINIHFPLPSRWRLKRILEEKEPSTKNRRKAVNQEENQEMTVHQPAERRGWILYLGSSGELSPDTCLCVNSHGRQSLSLLLGPSAICVSLGPASAFSGFVF